MTNYWTDSEINKLKNLLGKISFYEMTKRFPDRTRSSLIHKTNKLGLSNNFHFRKHFFNNDFWDIPNITNSYFGGFIAADGNISDKSVIISLSTKDILILERLKKVSEFTGLIRSYSRKNYQKETYKQVSTICFNTIGKWIIDLKKHFNIVPAKSLIIQPPNLNNDLLKFVYLIGFLDGDGWISFSRNRLTLGCVSGSYDLVYWLRAFLLKYFLTSLRKESRLPQIHQGTKNGEKKNCFYFTFSGSRAEKIVDFVCQLPIFKLDRKWNNPKVLEFLEHKKQQYPDFFKLTPELQNLKDQIPQARSPETGIVNNI